MRRKLRATGRGQSVVEFALVAPLFFFMLFGVLEGGRMIYAYNTINHAAQEAAREGILVTTTNVSQIRTRAVDAASPLEVRPGDVTVQVNGGAKNYGDREIGDRLRVTVNYRFTPVVMMLFGSSAPFQLSATTEMMIE
ncbi:MAG TPA: TadE family protein [Thermomicrobiales bacterium]|nr:TadE family protein [Thermomicrobiales bacterium]